LDRLFIPYHGNTPETRMVIVTAPSNIAEPPREEDFVAGNFMQAKS